METKEKVTVEVKRDLVSQLPVESEIEQLRAENTRLRIILDTLTKAGVGKGAIIEVYSDTNRLGVAVCRADVDEVRFVRNIEVALNLLVKAIGGSPITGAVRMGVTKDDPNQEVEE